MADDAPPADEAAITFNVKSSNDAKYTITIHPSRTVLQLKEQLSTKDYADLSPERQRLIYSGRVLKDHDPISNYKIKEGNTVHLVKSAASNERQNPANQGTSSSAPAASGVPQNLAAGPGANNMLAGLTGARYAGLANLPNANMFGPDGGMGPPPDPEQLAQMLEDPQVASTLNEAFSNPQTIETMIQQNPMLREMAPQMRQMMQNPEFRRMMTDPQMIRQSLQMQRMFGGGMGPFGGQGQSSSFPAPGATDTTEGTNVSSEGQQNNQQQGQQQPPNPFAMLGNQGGGAPNPFASLLNPGANSGTPGSGNDSTSQTGQQGQQQPANPFANPMGNPLLQNPQLMADMMSAMYPENSYQPTDQPQPGQGGQQQSNPFASFLQAMGGGGGAGMNPWGQFGGGSPPPNNPPDNRPPEERYAEQLRQLNDMGFYGFERNIEALRRAGGNVQGAVEYLLTNPGS